VASLWRHGRVTAPSFATSIRAVTRTTQLRVTRDPRGARETGRLTSRERVRGPVIMASELRVACSSSADVAT
jgi:hypothetical protein